MKALTLRHFFSENPSLHTKTVENYRLTTKTVQILLPSSASNFLDISYSELRVEVFDLKPTPNFLKNNHINVNRCCENYPLNSLRINCIRWHTCWSDPIRTELFLGVAVPKALYGKGRLSYIKPFVYE